MKSNSLIDYLACILFRVLGAFLRALPIEASFFIGRRVGDCFYYFDLKHRARTYANIKFALGADWPPQRIALTTKKFYRSFGQGLVEIFLIPKVDKSYMDKYIEIEGLENIYAGFKKGNGVVLAAMHAGGWELANIICANLGFPFYLFVKDQGFPRLNELLNRCRRQKGCRIIAKEGGLKQLIEALKNNSAIGITLDQGGKSGELVDFFGKNASMPTGGIKLALKYNCPVVPVYFLRKRGPKIKVIVGKEIALSRSPDTQKDVKENLQRFVSYFEGLIRDYPEEYLWTYKIWKYSDQRNILILSDGKAGHLHQSEALARIVEKRLKNKGLRVETGIVQIKFRAKLAKEKLLLSGLLSGKYSCQGCSWCLSHLLEADSYRTLNRQRPDIIISCGSSLAAVNYVVSRQTLARSIVLMRPGLLGLRKFDLVVMPQHDRPPKRKNVVVTKGALNMVTAQCLEEQSAILAQDHKLDRQLSYIGLLLGGNSKKFILDRQTILELIGQLKLAAEDTGACILLTTSRRTPAEAESLIKEGFKDYPHCKLMVIANEKNIPQAVGGILGLSRVLVVSPESISMVSEAAASARPVLVFTSQGLSRKHTRFLEGLSRDGYIHLSPVKALAPTIEQLLKDNPPVKFLDDAGLVAKAVEKIL